MFVNNDINQTNLNKIQDDEMALSEHIEEFSQRLIFCLILLVLSTLICFADIKQIVQIFQIPAVGIKFLQFSPGEYFFASVKIAFFGGILISIPVVIYQILLYTLPCLTKKERYVILPMTIGSGVLFSGGLWFSYAFLCCCWFSSLVGSNAKYPGLATLRN